MPKRDFDYRPNPGRAVYAFGPFDDELLSKIVPEITRFRFENATPITLFINSPGGVIRCLEILSGVLWDEDIDSKRCRVITVASGDAASAAATLLALGDYSIAYRRSEIYFHGARFREMEVTTESAAECAAQLAHKNREIAFRLANSVIRKLVHRYSIVCQSFDQTRAELKDGSLSDIECFVRAIFAKVGWRGEQVLNNAFEKTKAALRLSENILDKMNFSDEQKPIQQDAAVFRAVLKHELKQLSKAGWRLDDEGCSQLVSDYLLLRDYEFGHHQKSLTWVAGRYGLPFLTNEEFAEYKAINEKSEADALKWRINKVAPRLKPFWYFTVRLCQQLQEGENRLSATDAYWPAVLSSSESSSMPKIAMISCSAL